VAKKYMTYTIWHKELLEAARNGLEVYLGKLEQELEKWEGQHCPVYLHQSLRKEKDNIEYLLDGLKRVLKGEREDEDKSQ